MARHVVFLRAINLGAKRKVPMAELRALAEELGFTGVRTHLQSGNLVIDAPERSAEAVAAKLEPALEERFGFEIPVVVRSRAQLTKLVTADPLGDVADDPSRYIVVFCTSRQSQPTEVPPGEAAAAHGLELCLWCPDGANESKLWAKLRPSGTARNWRTVLKMLELASER